VQGLHPALTVYEGEHKMGWLWPGTTSLERSAQAELLVEWESPRCRRGRKTGRSFCSRSPWAKGERGREKSALSSALGRPRGDGWNV